LFELSDIERKTGTPDAADDLASAALTQCGKPTRD
jgi:hypothetical protein